MSVLRRAMSADFIISAVLLVIFAGAYLQAEDWPLRTKMFPVMVTVAGMALAVLKMVLTLRPRRRVADAKHYAVGDVEISDEDEEADQALEYVFARATRSQWLRVLAWVAAFFVGLWLVGAVPTILAFGIGYLLIEARTSLPVAVVYSGAVAGALYAAQELLQISLPPGLLLG